MNLSDAEFTVLRRTISTRGTVRVVLFPVAMIGWATLALTVLVVGAPPVAVLFPLAILVGGFEAIHALHVGVERIGRYLQVYYERPDTGARWETAAMAVGPALPGGGVDPLFSTVFAGAALINIISALMPPWTGMEVGVIGVLHLAFVIRVVRARGAAARQRAVELESFRAIDAQLARPKPRDTGAAS